MLVAVEESARCTDKGRSSGSRASRRASALTLTTVAALAVLGLNAKSLTPDRNVSGPHAVVGVRGRVPSGPMLAFNYDVSFGWPLYKPAGLRSQQLAVMAQVGAEF